MGSGPLRVAFVSDAVYPFNKGGKERRLHEISRRLAARGVQVDIYTMKWWPGPARLVQDGVTLNAICPLLPLYRNGRRSTLQALVFGLSVLRLLTRRFDVLDVDSIPYFPLFSGRLVASLRRRRLVATWHEVWGPAYWREYVPGSGRVAAFVERSAAAMPDLVVAVSDQTRTEFGQRLNGRTPVVTVPLGVDVEHLRRVPVADKALDILFAGRLLTNKRVDVLLRATALIAGEMPEVRVAVVGEGPERERLEELARELGIDEQVSFSDFLPGDEIYGWMKAATVFALPSVREGFGLVVLEANICGTPVVTVDHPDNAARLLVDEARNGFVCAPREDALADTLLRALREATAMRPAEYVVSRYSDLDWDAVAGRILDALSGTATAPTRVPEAVR